MLYKLLFSETSYKQVGTGQLQSRRQGSLSPAYFLIVIAKPGHSDMY